MPYREAFWGDALFSVGVSGMCKLGRSREPEVKTRSKSGDLKLEGQNNLNQVFSNLSMQQRGLPKTQVTVPKPRVSDSVGLGSCPKIYISNKFPCGNGVANLRTTLRIPLM